MKHRRNALYHQQAIQEALVMGLDFMRIPSTAALVSALKSKDKARIKAAADSLQVAADKYFASVPFPEVERIVGKKMLQTYMKYIPAEQRVGYFQSYRQAFQGRQRCLYRCLLRIFHLRQQNFAKFIRKPSLYKIGNDWMTLLNTSSPTVCCKLPLP